LTGVFVLAKATGFALAEGDPVLWDFTANEAVATGGFPIGTCVEFGGVASGATSVRTLLSGGAGGAAAAALSDGATFVANATTPIDIAVPFDCTVTEVRSKQRTQASSAGGTAVMTVFSAGNNLLAAANVDMESQAADTLVSHTLTGTAADLDLDTGDVIRVELVSDNADLTAGDDVAVLVSIVPR
jgi:hypothetical protein